MRDKFWSGGGHHHPYHGKTTYQQHGENQQPAGKGGIIPGCYVFSKKWILIRLHRLLNIFIKKHNI